MSDIFQLGNLVAIREDMVPRIGAGSADLQRLMGQCVHILSVERPTQESCGGQDAFFRCLRQMEHPQFVTVEGLESKVSGAWFQIAQGGRLNETDGPRI